MAMDFTVVFGVRQRFGDTKEDENEGGVEAGAPFVGAQKDFPFDCPKVDAGQHAMLLFQTQGVTVRQQLEINGKEIFGGIPPSIASSFIPIGGDETLRVSVPQWNGNVMLVHPGVLRENNVLRIRAGETSD